MYVATTFSLRRKYLKSEMSKNILLKTCQQHCITDYKAHIKRQIQVLAITPESIRQHLQARDHSKKHRDNKDFHQLKKDSRNPIAVKVSCNFKVTVDSSSRHTTLHLAVSPCFPQHTRSFRLRSSL